MISAACGRVLPLRRWGPGRAHRKDIGLACLRRVAEPHHEAVHPARRSELFNNLYLELRAVAFRVECCCKVSDLADYIVAV
jgi:hypothetical protein